MKNKFTQIATAFLFSATFLLPAVSLAQAGSLDLSFNNTGIVTTSFGSSSDDGAKSVAIQSDGKIVVAGYSNIGGNNDFALLRYNDAGSLDSTFGTAGKVTTAIGSSHDVGHAMAIRSNGKIVVGGWSDNTSGSDFALVQYNTDGSLDNSFGTGGIVTTAVSGASDRVYALSIQSDGKIIVAGSSNVATTTNFALARYNNDGTLDNSFGTSGKVITSFSGQASAHSIAIQSTGRIVVGGYDRSGYYKFAMAGYNNDGTLDNSYGTNGKVTTALSSLDDYPTALVVLSDDEILVTGRTPSTTVDDIALVRYTNNGAIDTSFGTGGKVITSLGSYLDSGESIAIQDDGKILVSGISFTSSVSNYLFSLVRYSSNGTLDSTFGSNGIVTTLIGTYCAPRSMVINNDKAVVVGFSYTTGIGKEMAAVRYNLSAASAINENKKQSTEIEVGPNPFSSEATIQINDVFHNATLIVSDYLGQTVRQIKNISGQKVTFTRGNLANGLYFISLTEGSKVFATKKIVITD